MLHSSHAIKLECDLVQTSPWWSKQCCPP